jgi:ubiquitin-conjugating enzyme E2 Q
MDTKKKEVKDKEKKSKTSEKDKKDKKPKAGSKDREKVVKQMQKEFDSWLEEADETANIEWKKTDAAEGRVFFRFGDAEYFSLTFPDVYAGKATAGWYLYTEADALTPKWMDVLNEFCEKDRTLSQVLSHAAEQYFEVVAHEDDEEASGDDGFDDFAGSEEEVKPKTNPGPTLDKEKYLDIGSPAATLRLLRDLKEIKDAKADLLGFEAEPVTDSRSGKQNLYHWEIRLSGFDGDLASDMKAYAKETGKEHVTLEMRFSADYPFTPPFVRVVRPRFKFQTGHVTIGGSICMELLTRTGWQSTNSIESVLIQIRAEMTCGGARLDSSYRGDYSEHEAWDAFYRAAKNHGWDSKGLGADMFPKIY